MKSHVLATLTLLAVAGCAASTKPAPPAAANAPAPTATPAPTPNAGFPLTPEERAEQEKKQQKLEELRKTLAGTEETLNTAGATIVTDPKTGEKQERIEKTNRGFFASKNRLYSTQIPNYSSAILREDAEAWYIPAPLPRKGKSKAELQSERALPAPLVMPAEEAEVVTPKRASEKLVFEEISEGLPAQGMWRENFALADLDGDGGPEIVSPPPRLSGRSIGIFKWDGRKWTQPRATFDDPEQVGMEYGGVACADMDGDGRVDIVFGQHGHGPAIAYNKGDWRFAIATRGIAKEMSVRALSIGDLDGDGRQDILAVSDIPENGDVRRQESQGITTARLPLASGYIPGIDARAFFAKPDGTYEQVHRGLDKACFGYSVALDAAPKDGLAPFFVESCRYNSDPVVLFTFDKAARGFDPFPSVVGEANAIHVGSAVGTYMGHPAGVVSYSKATPMTAVPNISGYGVTIYYRDGGNWARKRVLKVLHDPTFSQGLAMGDLDGDGRDDIVFADDVEGRLRVFLQRADGSFEELATALEPTYVNHVTAVRLADVDRDGRLDIVMAYQPLSTDPTRAGGIRVFRNRK